MTQKPAIIVLLAFGSALLGGMAALHFQTPGGADANSVIQPVATVNGPPHEAHRSGGAHPAAATERSSAGPEAGPTPGAAPDVLPAPPHFRMAAGRALDAVVHVRTAQRVAVRQGWSDWSALIQPWSSPQQIVTGSGSGVILNADGYIVTNHHVIAGADAIEIGLNDNRTLQAELVGSDPTTDIAVLKVEASGLRNLEWGNSDEVQVGDWVLAVGNPFDLTSTVTAGIVSAKARDIQLLRPDFDRSLFPVESFIQTDAAVNPGNSGGALVDAEGRLIGINTAIASKTGSYTGYAFAVPANLARKVADDLIQYGVVQRAFLGVNIAPVDEPIAQRLGLPSVEGVVVTRITSGSGADQAGMQEGDVILSVDGTPASTVPQLLERVNQYRPGEEATLSVWRSGHLVDLSVRLTSRSSWRSGADDVGESRLERQRPSDSVPD